jgi:hypothetical protein
MLHQGEAEGRRRDARRSVVLRAIKIGDGQPASFRKGMILADVKHQGHCSTARAAIGARPPVEQEEHSSDAKECNRTA